MRQLISAIIFAPKLVFNGINSMRLPIILLALFMRRDAYIYIHETGFSLREVKNSQPIKWFLIQHILQRRRLLCVSKAAADTYRTRFQSRFLDVVYENSGPAPITRSSIPPDNRGLVFLMIGSGTMRKGLFLFTGLAELARKLNRPWHFVWVGPHHGNEITSHTSNVHWAGWRENTESIINIADIFFLTSIDDPLPLAALDAIRSGKRIIAFRRTGIGEIVEGIPGCAVYSKYTLNHLYHAVLVSLNQQVDSNAIRSVGYELTSNTVFSQRLEEAIFKPNAFYRSPSE